MSSENLSEKVSVNVSSSVLADIDLLVENGYFANRSDFITTALHDAVSRRQSTIDHIISRNSEKHRGDSWFVGVMGYTKKDISEFFNAGESFSITGFGVLSLADDCDEEQVKAVIENISVKGKVRCSAALKAHYGLK